MKEIHKNKKRLSSLLALTVLLTNVQGNHLLAAPVKAAQVFSDVKENQWYTEAINKWRQSNIISGYEDGSFKPNKEVTRAELASMIARVFGLTDTTESKNYEDVEQNKWYRLAVSRVSSAGIMNDEGTKFNPNQSATREEFAYAIARAYKVTEGKGKVFKDQVAISDWALSYVNALAAGEYIAGRPGDNFAPKDKVTRAEVIAIIDRITAELIQEAGTYTQDVAGNLVVNTKDVILKDMNITGNLYLAEGIGQGDVTLDGITVKGQVFTEGGGENSIKINNAVLTRPIQVDVMRPVRIVNTGNGASIEIKSGSKVILAGDFDIITVPYGVEVSLQEGASVNKIVVQAQSANTGNLKVPVIKMAKGSVIKVVVANAPAEITGLGQVKQLESNAQGVKIEQKPEEVIAEKINYPIITGGTNTQANNGNTGGTTASTNNGNTGGSTPPQQDKEKWKLSWSDEFDGEKLNPDKWTYNNGFLNLNQEKQVYQSENAQVSDGMLKIVAKKEKTAINGKAYDYTSARILTKGKYAQKYGKVEVRAKLPVGKSIWPAIWMLPEDEEYTGWPTSGEIDIMESRGSVSNKVWGTLHYGDKEPNNTQSGSEYVFKEGQSIDQFHTYAIEWQPGEIKWFVDGELYQTQDNWFSISPQSGEKYAFPAPFDKKFHLVLNVALGGWYDGLGEKLEVDDTVFNGGKQHAMEVDYVRFYESADGTYKNAEDPDAKVPELPKDARAALADGNLIYDNTYEKYGLQDNKEANLPFGEGWNLIYLSNYAADAKASAEKINNVPFAKVEIKKGGNQNYAIQMIQHTTLGRGRTYKISFDAKASANRDIKFKIGGGESRGYAAYSEDYTGKLTTDIQHIEKTFTMKKTTDTAARMEFNLGLDTNTVWIGNVKLEEVSAEPVVQDFNGPKEPLKDGNLIYNGEFDKGKLDRLTYWNLTSLNGANANMVVPETTRDLNIDIKEGGSTVSDVVLDQRGLKLSENGSYNVTFSGKADYQKTIKVKLVGEDGQTIYAEEEAILSNIFKDYEFALTAKGSSTDKGRLVFEIGKSTAKICLDNIKVVQGKADFSNVEIFPLKNGDFTQGNSSWEQVISEGAAGSASITDQAQFAIDNVGSNPWSVMLVQKNMNFSAGVKYVVSFDASSTISRDIVVKTEEEGTWIEFFKQTVALTPEKQKFTFEYTMPSGKDMNLGLKFILGNTPQAPTDTHTIKIDNVVCEVKDGKFLKSEVKNGRFDKGMESWGQYIASENGAKANISADDQQLKIVTWALGNNPWEVQTSQKGIQLEKGKTYQVGFKVKSDEATKLKMSIGGEDANYNFTNYLTEDKIFNTEETEKEHSFTFTMTKDTDANTKISFDTGKLDETSIATTIYVDDVYIVELPSIDEEEVVQKTNLLKNGDFENADEYIWYSWSNPSAIAAITTGSMVTVNITGSGANSSDIVLAQSGIALEKGREYVIDFEAQVTIASSLRVSILNSSYEEYTGEYSTTVNLTPEKTNYQIAFKVDKNTDTNLTFRMEMGKDEWSPAYYNGANTIVIDNVILSVKKAELPAGNTIYLDDLSIVEKGSTANLNLLKDGNFSAQGAWQYGGQGALFSFDAGEARTVISNEGTNPWDVILFQPNIKLENGKSYIVSFKGRADAEKTIKLLTSDANYAEYFNHNTALTPAMSEYSFEFTADKDTSENLEFKIFMGGNIN